MKGFKIARIFGISIEIHWTWWLIFGGLIWVFAQNYLPQKVPGEPLFLYWLSGIALILVFFFSVLFHELSHSMVARYYKIPVERITFFILGGVAWMKESPKTPRAEFLISLAGPLSSLFLAAIFWLIGFNGLNILHQLVLRCLAQLFLINAFLAVFNLIPGFPLDGGRIFRAFWWQITKNLLKATKISKNVGIAIGVLLPIGGFLLIGLFAALWLGLISIFLIRGSFAEYENLVIREKLKKAKVREIMEASPQEFSDPERLECLRDKLCSPEDRLDIVCERMINEKLIALGVKEGNQIIGIVSRKGIFRYLERRKKEDT